MPADDREVFAHLVTNGTTPALDYITYALFAFERQQWIEHATVRNGAPPSQAEIDDWTANLTDSMFEGWRAKAASFFDSAARTYLADEFHGIRAEVLQTEIVRTVTAAGAFHKQLFINLLSGIVAPFIIGGMIVAYLAFSDRLPSIRDLTGIPKAAPSEVQPKPPAG